jgi:hypothetical protein
MSANGSLRSRASFTGSCAKALDGDGPSHGSPWIGDRELRNMHGMHTRARGTALGVAQRRSAHAACGGRNLDRALTQDDRPGADGVAPTEGLPGR